MEVSGEPLRKPLLRQGVSQEGRVMGRVVGGQASCFLYSIHQKMVESTSTCLAEADHSTFCLPTLSTWITWGWGMVHGDDFFGTGIKRFKEVLDLFFPKSNFLPGSSFLS